MLDSKLMDGPKALGKWSFKIGTMIEIPRAALTADEIAEYAEFFSFGTNDLTQTTYGLSRDDSGMFLEGLSRCKDLFNRSLCSLDSDGVGELMKIAIEKGRKSKPNLKLGICGEHGGEPQSIELCQSLGLDYVSCSPYRVSIAQLAAAQSAIENPLRSPSKKHKALDQKKKKIALSRNK